MPRDRRERLSAPWFRLAWQAACIYARDLRRRGILGGVADYVWRRYRPPDSSLCGRRVACFHPISGRDGGPLVEAVRPPCKKQHVDQRARRHRNRNHGFGCHRREVHGRSMDHPCSDSCAHPPHGQRAAALSSRRGGDCESIAARIRRPSPADRGCADRRLEPGGEKGAALRIDTFGTSAGAACRCR